MEKRRVRKKKMMTKMKMRTKMRKTMENVTSSGKEKLLCATRHPLKVGFTLQYNKRTMRLKYISDFFSCLYVNIELQSQRSKAYFLSATPPQLEEDIPLVLQVPGACTTTEGAPGEHCLLI